MAICVAPATAVSPQRARVIVKREAARNRRIARRDARRHLSLITMPPGSRSSLRRPAGIGGRLRGINTIIGDTRMVFESRFWVVPGSRQQVFRWLRRHPPRGSLGESYANVIFWGDGGPPHTLGATAVLHTAERADGETVVRADVMDGWEWPRSPLARVPAEARYLRISVSPGSSGYVVGRKGRKPRPTRYVGTRDARLIAGLRRVVDRRPAYQLYQAPSCGPDIPAARFRLYQFVFKTSPRGRTLARVSEETPFGICSSMGLDLGGRRRFALEPSWRLLQRAHVLIARARPR